MLRLQQLRAGDGARILCCRCCSLRSSNLRLFLRNLRERLRLRKQGRHHHYYQSAIPTRGAGVSHHQRATSSEE